MAFTAGELDNITNSALDYYLGRGEVYKQNIQSKPMLAAFDKNAGRFSGGKGNVSLAVKAGQGGLTLAGYTHDDTVTYGNPASTKRANYAWKEMFIGLGITHTELKHDGITVVEAGAGQTTSMKDGREEHALANMLEEKIDEMNEDYAAGMDAFLHGDGTSDAKAIAGIGAFILPNPALGSTGGLARTNTWWRNRAATAAALAAGSGPGAVTSSAANGGALLQFLQAEQRQLDRYARGTRKSYKFAGSDFIGAIELELRANGNYGQTGWFNGDGTTDGAMQGIKFGGVEIVYDPTLDDLGLEKRMYDIDMRRLKLLYMSGEKMKKASPARPADQFLLYKGVTTTAVMAAQQLNTSGVYDIA